MALTKVGNGGIENVTNSANATFLTIDASEQITVASEGGAVTTSVQQGLAKAWFNGSSSPAIVNSFNFSSVTDNDTGQFFFNYTNVMSNGNTGAAAQPTSVDSITITCSGTTSQMRCYCFDGSAYVDTSLTGNICGDLA